jgi:hypothetical protein
MVCAKARSAAHARRIPLKRAKGRSCGMRRRTQRKGDCKPTAHRVSRVAKERCCQHQQQSHAGGTERNIESGVDIDWFD